MKISSSVSKEYILTSKSPELGWKNEGGIKFLVLLGFELEFQGSPAQT